MLRLAKNFGVDLTTVALASGVGFSLNEIPALVGSLLPVVGSVLTLLITRGFMYLASRQTQSLKAAEVAARREAQILAFAREFSNGPDAEAVASIRAALDEFSTGRVQIAPETLRPGRPRTRTGAFIQKLKRRKK